MSKNIIIQEGGIGRQFTAAKLRTSEVGGGSVTWIPEDETSLTTKHISANGTYNASDDDAYGYSTVYVNIAGGSGSANADGIPTIENGTEPGGIGSSVIGTDPETGNEIAVGVDEGGNIVQTEVPSAIKVLKAPDKTEYTDGESINYAGIVVHMKKKDDTDFTDTNHLTGLLLLDELTLPETTAQYDGPQIQPVDAPSFVYDGTVLTMAGNYTPDGWSGWYLSKRTTWQFQYCMWTNSEKCYLWYMGNGVYGYFNSDTVEHTVYHGRGNTPGSNLVGGVAVQPGGYGTYVASYMNSPDNTSVVCPVSPEAGAVIISNGTEYGTSTMIIPVQWTSPYDGRTFNDSFEITVSLAGSGHTGSGGHF